MSENTFFAAFFFPSLAAAIIFSMKYVAAIVQSRSQIEQDEAYREMATQATHVQSEALATLSSIASRLTAIEDRLAGLEKILKEVE